MHRRIKAFLPSKKLGLFFLITIIYLRAYSTLLGQQITTVAGTGNNSYNGDNQAATSATLYSPIGIVLDATGNLFIADNFNHRIRKVAVGTGQITTVAGTGSAGYNGDNQAATSAILNTPAAVALDAAGNLYIADVSNHRIRRVDAGTGQITTVAGTGSPGYNGDNQAATSATLKSPIGITLDASGNLFIADVGNHRIRKVTAGTGQITTVAGTGSAGYNGDNQAATSAILNSPAGVALDASGNLFIADRFNHRIRRVDVGTGQISTVAGTGSFGYNGDNQAATAATLNLPAGVALDASGNLFIADYDNHRIRKVAAGTGQITTVVGTGSPGYNGDNQAATAATLKSPAGVALDAFGNLFITDQGNQRIRKVYSSPPLPILPLQPLPPVQVMW